MAIASIPEIIADIKAGKMVILTDAEDRENEGDVLMAAEFVTPEAINFMIKHARGLVCMPMSNEMVDRLQLPMMADRNGARHGTPFTVSIEAAHGISTGISAVDRAHTVRTAVAPNAVAADIVQPGHIFPLRAQDGGVLVRAGHTEAGCDLARMAGLTPAAVICEVINDDGTMARMPQLEVFAEEHGIKIATIADLIQYRSQNESLIEEKGSVMVDTAWGQFKQVMFTDTLSQETHVALVKGEPTAEDEVWVRVHEPFSAMDFLAPSNDHSWSLPDALARIQSVGHGVVILLHRTETGADLLAKGLPQQDVPARVWDKKTFGIGAQILASLNVKKMRIMGKTSAMTGLTGFGLEVVGFEMPNEG